MHIYDIVEPVVCNSFELAGFQKGADPGMPEISLVK